MTDKERQNVYFAAISGMCAVFIGLGLGRFSYSPLMPAMVKAGWFTAVEAAHLVAINLVGYMVGAVFLRFFSKKFSPVTLTALALITCTIGIFGRAIDLGTVWFTAWRFMVGFFGAVLMIVTPSFVLTSVSLKDRSKTNGVIFTGLGLGIMVAGLLVAYFANSNFEITWVIFGIISVITSIICLKLLPSDSLTRHHQLIQAGEKLSLSRPVIYLILAYALMAMAFVPHTLFLVDYLVTQRHYTHSLASFIYALLGVGAMLGALFGSLLAHRFGVYRSLLFVASSCILATLLIFCQPVFLVALSAFLMGLFFTGIVMLKSTRLLELEDATHHAKLWSMMTIGFSIGQVIGSYLVIYVQHFLRIQGIDFVFAALMFFVSMMFILLARHPHE